jgi:hypothetical protein
MGRLGHKSGRCRVTLVVGVLLLGAGVAVWLAVRDDRRAAAHREPPSQPVSPEMAHLKVVGQGLGSVRPGMLQTEVETHLGRPDSKNIGPVATSSDGQAVYRVRYAAVLDEPLPSAPTVRGYCEVELEYDAGRHGHPLLRIIITPKPPPSDLSLATTS